VLDSIRNVLIMCKVLCGSLDMAMSVAVRMYTGVGCMGSSYGGQLLGRSCFCLMY
jgi:hypothetical protein